MCAQSHALGTRTKFQREILTINGIYGIVYFRKISLESSRNVSETTPCANWKLVQLALCGGGNFEASILDTEAAGPVDDHVEWRGQVWLIIVFGFDRIFRLERSAIFMAEFRAQLELGARNFHPKPCMFTLHGRK